MEKKEKKGKIKSYLLALAGTIIAILLDQYTKYLAVLHLKGKTSFVLIDGVFELQYLCLLYTSHLGGKQQLGSQIEHNEIDLLIFFRDPLTPRSHEPDVNDIVKLCDMYNIPIATNIATAEALILALDRGDLDWREMYK